MAKTFQTICIKDYKSDNLNFDLGKTYILELDHLDNDKTLHYVDYPFFNIYDDNNQFIHTIGKRVLEKHLKPIKKGCIAQNKDKDFFIVFSDIIQLQECVSMVSNFHKVVYVIQ